MNRTVIASFSGHCNFLNKKHSIQVKFAEVYFAGSLSPGYKKLSYKCSHSNECTCLDEYGACDLFNNVTQPY